MKFFVADPGSSVFLFTRDPGWKNPDPQHCDFVSVINSGVSSRLIYHDFFVISLLPMSGLFFLCMYSVGTVPILVFV
jgi:hypothetical protein